MRYLITICIVTDKANFSYGNKKMEYLTSAADWHKKLNIKSALTNRHHPGFGSSIIEQHKKRTAELENKNAKFIPFNRKSSQPQIKTTWEDKKLTDNFHKSHINFGSFNEFKSGHKRSISPFIQSIGDIGSNYKNPIARYIFIADAYSKKENHQKTTFKIGSSNVDPFRTSYQVNHPSLRSPDNGESNDKYIEKSKRRMRQSKVFQGKDLDAVNLHNTKMQTSYQVAVSTGPKPQVVRNNGKDWCLNLGKSSVHLGTSNTPGLSETKEVFNRAAVHTSKLSASE